MHQEFDTDLLGLFNMSFDEKIIRQMKVTMKGKPNVKMLKKLLGPMQHNVDLSKNLYREYAALQYQGYKPAKAIDSVFDNNTATMINIIQNKFGYPVDIVSNFMSALIFVAKKWPKYYKKWQPVQWSKSEKMKKSLKANQNIFTKTLKIGTNIAKFGTLAAFVGGGLILYNMTKKD